MDPHGVEDSVRNLRELVVVNAFEDRKEQGDVFDDELITPNINSIKYVKWMFYKEEDAGTQDFLSGPRENE